MEEFINEDFKVLKEITKSKYYGINIKTQKEVIIFNIRNDFFNKKDYDIYLNKITEVEKIHFAKIEKFLEKDNNKIIIVEKGEGNLEEGLSESIAYYSAKQIQYIFNQINIAINILYDNNIQFNKLQLSDIIYYIKDNKPIFKIIPFFLVGIQKKKHNKNNQLQIIKSLINKLYFNQDSSKINYTSDEDLNDLLLKLANNKLGMKHYLNHNFFVNDKTKKEINDFILFNENSNLECIFKLNEEYYLIKNKLENKIKIIKNFPKIIFEYKFDFNLDEYCKSSLLKDDVLLIIFEEYYLFLKINFSEKKITLIQKFVNYHQKICQKILELNEFIILHMYKINNNNYSYKFEEQYENYIIILEKINYNNIISYQLNYTYKNKYIVCIEKIDNNNILLLSYEDQYILYMIKIKGFKIIKKIDKFTNIKGFIYCFDIKRKNFCLVLGKTLLIHLNGIFLIDLLNSKETYEIPGYNDDDDNSYYINNIHYDEFKKTIFFLNESLNEVEIDTKEKKIKIIKSLILSPKYSDFLFLLDNTLITRDSCSGKSFKKSFVTYFFYK